MVAFCISDWQWILCARVTLKIFEWTILLKTLFCIFYNWHWSDYLYLSFDFRTWDFDPFTDEQLNLLGTVPKRDCHFSSLYTFSLGCQTISRRAARRLIVLHHKQLYVLMRENLNITKCVHFMYLTKMTNLLDFVVRYDAVHQLKG